MVRVIDVARLADGRLFVVMERLYGRSLREVLRERRLDGGAPGRLAFRQAASLVAQALAGLAAAHALGVVHRDIKPENLVLTRDGCLKVLDFGIAKVFDPARAPITLSSGGETRTGVVVGTPAYLSPEQIRGEPVSPATDVYAAGLVLAELITGAHPLCEPGQDVLHAHLERPPRALGALAPPELEAVVHRALDKDPRRRFATALEMKDALEEILRRTDDSRTGAVAASAAQPAATSRGKGGSASPAGRVVWGTRSLAAVVFVFALIELTLHVPSLVTSATCLVAPSRCVVDVTFLPPELGGTMHDLMLREHLAVLSRDVLLLVSWTSGLVIAAAVLARGRGARWLVRWSGVGLALALAALLVDLVAIAPVQAEYQRLVIPHLAGDGLDAEGLIAVAAVVGIAWVVGGTVVSAIPLVLARFVGSWLARDEEASA